MTGPTPVVMPSAEILRELAQEVGVCVRPVLHQVVDTVTGETHRIPVPCGATLTSKCPPCADRNRRLRIQQCKEGWHLTEDPEPTHKPKDDQDQDQDDDADKDDDGSGSGGGSSRRQRSTRRRQDVPDLPRLPVAKHTTGRTFETSDGKKWRPSTFLTVTMPSYGKVNADGTPVDPGSYDYERAGLDALHMPKLFDRLVQNLRRAVGYEVQYFGVVEPQKRLAPHLHIAIRGAIPRKLLKQVIAATYHQLWWPDVSEPVYDVGQGPVWDEKRQAFVDPENGAALPTWNEALAAIDADDTAAPAHVSRFGSQVDIQGLIADSPACERRIGYLAKYLGKSIAEGININGAELSVAQERHIDRLHSEVNWSPCCPECPNWLRYGVQPKKPDCKMAPGYCNRKAHRKETLGCGGRRVLVSRRWTGKTLDGHRADRRDVVAETLASIGIEVQDGYSATEQRPDGEPRYEWRRMDPDEDDQLSYRALLATAIAHRQRWRADYERAKQQTAINSASAAA